MEGSKICVFGPAGRGKLFAGEKVGLCGPAGQNNIYPIIFGEFGLHRFVVFVLKNEFKMDLYRDFIAKQ